MLVYYFHKAEKSGDFLGEITAATPAKAIRQLLINDEELLKHKEGNSRKARKEKTHSYIRFRVN